MGTCRVLKFECPFALVSENAPVPCIGSQEECDKIKKVNLKQNNMANPEKLSNEEIAKLVAEQVYNPGKGKVDFAVQLFVEETVLSDDCQGYTVEGLERRILAHLNTIDKS